MDRKLTIIDEITRVQKFQYCRYPAYRPSFASIRGERKTPGFTNFMASVINLCEHALRNCEDSDMVGISIRNEVNMRDKVIGISFRRKDQLSTDTILNFWQKFTQSNSRFNGLDKLVLGVHSLKIPVGFGGVCIKPKVDH